MPKHRTKNTLGLFILIGVLLAAASCSRNNSPPRPGALRVLCAPETLGNDEWAVLVIFQSSDQERKNEARIKGSMLESRAKVARVLETTGISSNVEGAYRIQVYHIRPLNDGEVLTISAADFENLPPNSFIPPISVRSVNK